MDFGDAIRYMKDGKRVTRAPWAAAGVFVYYVPAASYPAQTGAAKAFYGDSAVPYLAYLAIKRADGDVCVFVPGMDSILADDWQVLD